MPLYVSTFINVCSQHQVKQNPTYKEYLYTNQFQLWHIDSLSFILRDNLGTKYHNNVMFEMLNPSVRYQLPSPSLLSLLILSCLIYSFCFVSFHLIFCNHCGALVSVVIVIGLFLKVWILCCCCCLCKLRFCYDGIFFGGLSNILAVLLILTPPLRFLN